MPLAQGLADILFQLVEAYRSIERDKRQPIYGQATETSHYLLLMHPGFPADHPGIYPADLLELQRAGLVSVTQSGRSAKTVDITSLGFTEYERLHSTAASAPDRVQSLVRSYVDSEAFRRRHPKAFAKWERAEALLWRSDSGTDFSAIGHYCREVAQELGTSLLAHYPVASAPTSPERSKVRVAAVLQAQSSGSNGIDSNTNALLEYWSSLIDLDQRQEHGSQKANDPLTWEDGRRVVFATLFAMTEIDRLVNRPKT